MSAGPAEANAGGRIAPAISQAVAYLRGRQCRNGGFCFYRNDHLEEPNLHDTYHAVVALRSAGAQVDRMHDLAAWLECVPLHGASYCYYYVFTLEALGLAPLVGAERRAVIEALEIDLPQQGSGAIESSWLYRVLQIVRLKRRYCGPVRFPELVTLLRAMKRDGGYGAKPNLLDTAMCLRILRAIDVPDTDEQLRAFVEAHQHPSSGFTLTRDSSATDLDVVRAGIECCHVLGIPVRHPGSALRFALACQTGGGGYSRVPDALPDIEQTHRALEVMHLLGNAIPPADASNRAD